MSINEYLCKNYDEKHKGYVTDLITDQAIAWLKKQESSETPFFLMLHHKAPHRTWQPDTVHLDEFKGKVYPVPANFFDNYETMASPIRSMS